MLKSFWIKHQFTLLSILVTIFWGSLFPMVKLGYREFAIDTAYIPNILLFAGIRFAVSGSAIMLYCGAKRQAMLLPGSSLIKILCVGFFAVVLHYTCTYWGLSLTDSTKTAMLKQLAVFVFIPFSFLFFKEDRFSIKKIIGAILGFGGVVALSVHDSRVSLGIGEILIILASVCTVISNVMSKKVMNEVSPIVVTGYSQTAGGAFLILLGWLLGGRIERFSLFAIVVFLYICVASVISYSLWYYVVKHGDLSKLFIIKFLEPLFAGIFSALILGENIWKWEYLIAILFIGAAINISCENGRKTRRKRIHVQAE